LLVCFFRIVFYHTQNRDAPDTIFARYPANPKAGYRISGKGRIPYIRKDIRPDTWLDNYIFGKISKIFIKNSFNNYRLLQTLNKA
jgi:hypothetical protein